jgi:hypothetical protein
MKKKLHGNENATMSEEDFIPPQNINPPKYTQKKNVLKRDCGIKPEDVQQRKYTDYVTDCVKTLMQYGTDRYGKKPTPLMVTMLDVETKDCPPPDKLPRSKTIKTPYRNWHYGPPPALIDLKEANPVFPDVNIVPWRGEGRDTFFRPSCSEWSEDQPTLYAMYKLSDITGDNQYQKFVDKVISYCTGEVCEKGLYWWGSHRYFEVFEDNRTSNGGYHEILVKRPIWETIWKINRQSVIKHIEAMWEWHVYDKETGAFNRHSDKRKDHAFAHFGGQIIYALAFLYSKTSNKEHLEGAKKIAKYLSANTNKKTGLVPSNPDWKDKRWDGNYSTTLEIGQYSYFLLKSYEVSGDELFKKYALQHMKGYYKYAWDPAAGKFFGAVSVADGRPALCSRIQPNYKCQLPSGYIDLWQPYQYGWEFPMAAAQAYAYGYTVTKDPLLLEAAEKWASFIRDNPPENGCRTDTFYEMYARLFSKDGAFAEQYGQAISFFTNMYVNTGDEIYLSDAKTMANEAVSKLYYKGIFKGHPSRPYYCATDGVGHLLVALLQLDRALELKDDLINKENIILNGENFMNLDNW